MEIYTNSSVADRTVILDFPVIDDAQVDAKIFHDGEEVFTFTTLGATDTAVNGGFYTATIPLFLDQFDSTLKIHYDVTYLEVADQNTYTVSKIFPVEVVTPILTKAEIKAVWDTATDAEVTMIEKAVRHVVQAYTGQQFGRYIGTHSVNGSGGNALHLPQRLISIDAFNGRTEVEDFFRIDNDGYTLRFYQWGVPPVKADAWGLHQHVGGVIHNPNNISLTQFANGNYEISGHWGWEAVPDAVKEAAKLLVNDYACADAQYRDRYLVSMTAADWRIQFYSGAYLRTGNVRADQLLADYVVTRGWGII
jgi:hypothetical protein